MKTANDIVSRLPEVQQSSFSNAIGPLFAAVVAGWLIGRAIFRPIFRARRKWVDK